MKTCPSCAKVVAEQDAACPWCHAPLGPSADAIPVGTSGKAVASLILGIPFFFFLTAIAAVVLGHLAKRDIGRSGGRLKGDRLATAGLVLGYAGAGAMLVIVILAAIAVPNLMRARRLANEASAIGSLRVILAASTSYTATYRNGFPPSLAALGPSSGGGNRARCDHANLIDGVLAGGRKDGYLFTYAGSHPLPGAAPGCSDRGFEDFRIDADPATRGTTGERSFFVDASGVIRYNRTRPATAGDPPLD